MEYGISFPSHPQRVSALASADPPKTYSAMRSFIGAFKAISHCIPHYASLLSPLEDSTKGLTGAELIKLSPDLLSHFQKAQLLLKSPSMLTIPTASNQLVLTADASPINRGLGVTLFIRQGARKLLAQFYSFKLKDHQINYFPCELEVLANDAGVNHFTPYARVNPLQV